ncbi:hypothetical protein ACGFYA_04185 [Streptomyces sp. NPDC048305]|uniref:hypothetical protein n=1 Tax=Streptomyces sp. NPDC048305 TaxID=3365532 RepID=UPI0037101438
MAAILTGESAVVVSLITGLGASLQGLVTDTLFGEDAPAASASPNPAPPASGSAAPDPKTAPPAAGAADSVAVAVLPGESGSWLVSGQRVSPADRAVLTGPNDQERLEQLFRRIDVVSLHRTAYKLSVTNASASTVRVVDIVPVITKRTAALDTTLIEPLGGMADDTIPAELDLNDRSPVFTENGKAYFDYTTQVLKPGESFVMAVESKLTDREYVEYHLRLDYIDDKGKNRSAAPTRSGQGPRVPVRGGTPVVGVLVVVDRARHTEHVAWRLGVLVHLEGARGLREPAGRPVLYALRCTAPGASRAGRARRLSAPRGIPRGRAHRATGLMAEAARTRAGVRAASVREVISAATPGSSRSSSARRG